MEARSSTERVSNLAERLIGQAKEAMGASGDGQRSMIPNRAAVRPAMESEADRQRAPRLSRVLVRGRARSTMGRDGAGWGHVRSVNCIVATGRCRMPGWADGSWCCAE